MGLRPLGALRDILSGKDSELKINSPNFSQVFFVFFEKKGEKGLKTRVLEPQIWQIKRMAAESNKEPRIKSELNEYR